MKDKLNLSIPNILTLSNAFCGTMAILLLFSDINDRFTIAVILILLGGIFDLFDGKIARKLNMKSSLGEQLDSLSDLITFGVAPVALYANSGLINIGLPSYIVLSGYVLSGVYRLARHNVLKDEKGFKGCPITVSGVVLSLMFLVITNSRIYIEDYTFYVLNLFMLLAIFMVSRVKIKRFI
ncbi:MAG: CDP-diacylglycerol--serine O-phosphatidyltransferase [Clostridiales bacterium]|nr:CDP-diacylglycerol--serine O-phosphatidyltransferase [Clostridiales bacterium]